MPILMGGVILGAPQNLQAYSELKLEEIIVTAQKRDESIQDIPVAVTAVGQDQLERSSVQNIMDVQFLAPSLQVANHFGGTRIFIRGIGLTSISLGADGSTAFHVDGTIIARPGAQGGAFFDLERVEVLRGPQGTLYGRNATAGSINLITKKPSEELEGKFSLSYGNYNEVILEGAVGGALSDKIQVRIAGQYHNRDGFGENILTGKDIDNVDSYNLRGLVRFLPTDELEILLSVDHSREDDANYAAHTFGAYDANILPLTGIVAGGSLAPDIRDVNSDIDIVNDRKSTGLSATVSWERDGISLKSITSYRDFQRFNRHDLDGVEIDAGGRLLWTLNSEQFSQELQFGYASDDWDFISGLYYFEEKMAGVTFVDFDFFCPSCTFDEDGKVDVKAYAVFFQGNYHVTDNLNLTAGIRYSDETRESVGTFEIFGDIIPSAEKKSWNAVTPKFGIDYHINDEFMVFGSVARGFKSGLFNIGSLNPAINPEFLWSYEVGLKATLLDGILRTNLSAFYYDYKDLQVGRVVNTQLVTGNAASAENIGVEFEFEALLTEGLVINGSAAWLDVTFKEYNTANPADIMGLEDSDRSGNYLPHTPKYSFNIGAQYTLPVTDFGEVSFRGELAWKDKTFFTVFNEAQASQGAYAMLNASIAFISEDGDWTATLYGKNLTDKTVFSEITIASTLFGLARTGALLNPRTYGVRLGYNF
ncbi:MAG: TonB-dependent receptor [Emcibacter sp.]|nr:TonB-dependent receptor [Emcibacter sp.]